MCCICELCSSNFPFALNKAVSSDQSHAPRSQKAYSGLSPETRKDGGGRRRKKRMYFKQEKANVMTKRTTNAHLSDMEEEVIDRLTGGSQRSGQNLIG